MSSTMTELKGGLIYNKQLWAVTGGTLLGTSVEAARKQLQKARSQILAGISHYRPFNEDSEKKLKSCLDGKTLSFVVNIARQMNLDALQAWDLMVFYLEHEFRGSEDNLESFLESDVRKEQLVKDICMFYWSERAFLLKCIGIYLAYWQDKEHPFSEVFSELLSDLTANAIFESLLKQLKQLTEQNAPTSSTNLSSSTKTSIYSTTSDQWMSIYLQEQLSVLHNLTLFVDGYQCQWRNILETLKLCKHPLLYRHKLKRQHLPLLQGITFSQVVLLLRMIDVSDLGFAKTLWLEDGLKLHSSFDTEMQELYKKEEHPPLLLVWMLFNFYGVPEEEFSKYRKFGFMATKLNVFSYLSKLLNEPMFKSEATRISEIAYSTVYKLIDCLTSNFEPEKLQPRENLLSLCATLLHQPSTADMFWNSDSDSGIRLTVDVAMRRFPLEFESLVHIVTSLASASPRSCEEVLKMVSELDFLLEPLVPALLQLLTYTSGSNNSVTLTGLHRPLPHVDALVLHSGTLGTLVDQNPHFVCWKVKYSFWLAVHSAQASFLTQISLSSGGGVEPAVVVRALASVRCIAACLESGCEIQPAEPAMVLPIELVFSIMERFLLVSNPKSAMMAACLEVAASLVTEFPSDVTNKLRALDFLPTTQPDEGTVMTYISFAQGHFFNAGVFGRIVVNEERPVGSFPLIRAYLSFLQKLIMSGCKEKEQQSVALSGLVYVILEVFPRCYEWGYAAMAERTQLSHLCLELFHHLISPAALSGEGAGSSSEFERLLAHISLYALLYTDNGHTLLRICALGEAELKGQMLKQTSWLKGGGVELVDLVRLALSILIRVLMLKDSVKTGKDLSPTEQLIYASPNAKNSLQVVPNIAYYVYHCFNPNVPILAVKVLKRIALEVPMTLRACLAMDGDVIREAFVAKLDSPHQSMQLKVAILELITACIHTQPGATEAFFNIHHPEESKRLFSKDKTPNDDPSGCLTYACKLLAKAKDEPMLVRSMLYGAVVELLHALWMHHQKILLSFLREKKDFWADLCAPLFLPPSHKVRGYAQVLNIVSSEMYMFGSGVHKQLMEQMQKLFSDKNNYLVTWSKFITHSLCVESSSNEKRALDSVSAAEDPVKPLYEDEVKERLALMTAWKDMLLVALGELSNVQELKLSEKQQSALASHVLTALEQEASRDASASNKLSLRPAAVTMLAELLLILQAKWESSCFADSDTAVCQLQTVLLRFSYDYHGLPPRTRTAILSSAIQSVKLLRLSLCRNEVAMEILVKATITMVSQELQAISVSRSNENEGPSKLSVTLLQVLCEAISEAAAGPWTELLSQSKIACRVIVSLSEVLCSQTNLQFAQSALYLLLSLAGSERNAALLNLNFVQDQLWLQLTPKEKLLISNQPFQSPESWVNSPWSSVFCVGVEFVCAILNHHGVRALETAVNFCAVQENALLDCLLLARHTLEPSALSLSEAALNLLLLLVQHSNQWRLQAFRTFSNLVRGVSMCLDISVGLLTRPSLIASMAEGTKHLSSALHGENSDSSIQITPKVSSASNKLMNMVILSSSFLLELSPPVSALLCDRELDIEAWIPLVDLNWSAPAQPGQRQNSHCLTLGTLLAAVNVFSYTASQHKTGNVASRHGRSPLTRALRAASSPVRFGGTTPATSSDQDAREVAGITAWTKALDFDRAQLGLQKSLALLASQSLLLLRARDPRDQALLRRELSTEMSQYVELMRRTYGDKFDSSETPPERYLPTIEEKDEPARPAVVRSLQLSEDPKQTSTSSNESRRRTASSAHNAIYACSDSDYLKLMAHIFQKVFRE
ncbi:hypothetical protein FOCC_FOCC004403 [Frankliniella occidentalis]|uniref:Nucleoporin NUP188 n=1 Tax=Frankliniella occidentalis TaxID=133901 RepID=A0A6J1SIN2_FRAOC|nr:nucleoporin Nup188 [Frankliniella occidentalis]KAE8748809.1 hypothetical protein FOCC_FOCC004403 [Frankliniella occidentalis]